MTQEIFLRYKQDNQQIAFDLVETKFIPMEKSWTTEYGIYNVFKRDFYNKSNMKKCYVDTFVKEVKVERRKLCPTRNGYEFRVKHNFLQEVINEALS